MAWLIVRLVLMSYIRPTEHSTNPSGIVSKVDTTKRGYHVSSLHLLIRARCTENTEKVRFGGYRRFDAINHLCRSHSGGLIVMGLT
jgi:hypothetical protein